MWPSRLSLKIATELITINFVTLTVVTLLMMVIGVLREAIRQGLTPALALQLIPYAIPNALVFATPASTLYSVCVVFGRMSTANELIALQSVGIPSFVCVRPALVTALLLSLLTVWFVDLAFVWGHKGVENIILSAVDEVAYSTLRRQGSYTHGNFSIVVHEVRDRALINPTISFQQSNSKTIVLTAKEAQLTVEEPDNHLVLSLVDGVATFGDSESFHFRDRISYTIPLLNGDDNDLTTANPSHLPLSLIPLANAESKRKVQYQESIIAARTGFDFISARFSEALDAKHVKEWQQLQQQRQRLFRIAAESHRRWASGFSCFAFTVLGIPLAVLLKTSDYMTTFGVCFVPILIVYYPIFALGLDLAKSGTSPAYFPWLANCIALCAGLMLMKRAINT